MVSLRSLSRIAVRSGAVLGQVAAPWLTGLIRLALAQAFLSFQLRLLMLDGPAASLSSAWPDLFAHSVMRSPAGGAVQALCPLLLAAGLFSRIAALAMLLQVLVLGSDFGAAWALWASLLGWLMITGPGALSLDWLFSPTARTGAVPGLTAVAALFGWTRRVLTPAFLLAVRLALAAVLVGLLAHPTSDGAARMAMSAVAQVAPETLALPLTLLLAALLLAGLLIRPLALTLAVSGVVGVSALGADGALAWLLLCGVLLVQGGGRYALDHRLARWATARTNGASPAAGPHIVVVGGGFGGMAVVRGLRGVACRVTLIDRRNHHLFQPLLYQVATAGLSPADIATPIREMLRDQANARVVLGEVSGIDSTARQVRLGAATLGYDVLVLATGARHSYFGRDDWSAQAPGLKSIEEAIAIRRRLLLAFEEAESTEDLTERDAWLTFVIVGGGPTGVELAGAIAELARFGLTDEFRAIDPARARVVLIQSGPRLLPTFPPELSAEAERALRHLGVELRLDARVEDVRGDGVTVGSVKLASRTVLWAAGVMASPAAAWLGAGTDSAGRLIVSADLSVPGQPDIFAIGDTAASSGWAGKPVPGLAPAAKQGGEHVARTIRAKLAGTDPVGAFRYRHRGSLATIGRQAAVADFGRIRLRGAFAWWLWGAAHIAFLVGGRNRVVVTLEWLWAYLTYRRGTRLITGQA